MKTFFAAMALASLALISNTAFAESDDEKLLKAMHKFGITKCDKFILANSRLKGDWTFFTRKHLELEGTKEATVMQVYGKKNDTVKTSASYLQTTKACFVTDTSTLTDSGPCSEVVDKDLWYVKQAMPTNDYTLYQNKGGVDMFVKEIEVGNFKACVREFSSRNSSPHG